jgi:hypothetical protein
VSVQNGGKYTYNAYDNTISGTAPTPAQYTLDISVAPVGAGDVTKNPDLPAYDKNTQVTVTAASAIDYEFVNWTGTLGSSLNPFTFAITQNTALVANFQFANLPDIPIIRQIVEWIKDELGKLWMKISTLLAPIVDTVTASLSAVFSTLIAPITTAVDWLKEKVLDIWNWVQNIPTNISDLAATIWSTVSSAVTSAIGVVSTWISSSTSTISSWVTTKSGELWTWTSGGFTSLNAFLIGKFTEITNTITSIPGIIGDWFEVKLDIVFGWVEVPGTTIWDRIKSWAHFLWTSVVPIGAIFNLLHLNTFWSFDPSTHLPTPFHYDDKGNIIAGEGPDTLGIENFIVTHVADPILDAIKNVWTWFEQWFIGVWEKITGGIKRFFTETLPGWFEALWEKIKAGISWVWDKVGDVASGFIDDIMALVGIHSPILPEGGLGTLKGVAKIGLALAGGLGLMTLAGQLVHPLHSLGLEHISAMVYDMTNYKLLIGAGMGVIAVASIRTPMTQYMNRLLRPNIPSERDAAEMYDRELIPYDQYSQYLALRGYPDMWHEKLASLTETPLRYFGLAAIARNGYFDTAFFEKDLIRGGYPPETRKALLDMFNKTFTESVRGTMSGTAIKRFKEGFTTESQFNAEMTLLGYSASQFPTYLAAAKLDYAYDYLTDLVAAYRDAVRKGNISLDEYRSALLNLGMVPERVEGYVLRERARLKPKEKLTPVTPVTPVYETDAGKIRVDTIRRLRRKGLITSAQEIAALQGLGMDPDYAGAIADNDAARLSPAGE